MKSFLRRLGSPTPPTEDPKSEVAQHTIEVAQPTAREPEEIRIGLDFGTSTTLVAAKIGSRTPRVIELEPGRAAMPSYIALAEDGLLFGTRALNSGVNAHSVKLALRDNDAIPELNGMTADRAAFALIKEALRLTLEQLKREGRLPPSTERLEVTSNVGCTPAFSLQQRTLLRDVCRAAGLKVEMPNLVEEPVAAAFEVVRTGVARDGRTMVIDIGGGTLDVCVADVRNDGTEFVIYATGGAVIGGDLFTKVIVERLTSELARVRGTTVDALVLSLVETTALWVRAETAKVDLSSLPTVRVALPTLGEEPVVVEITREWYSGATGPLVVRIESFVTDIYRRSRLTLDRGGPMDPHPGTDIVTMRPNGVIEKKLSDLKLIDDGIEHLDTVYLVGGGSRMPAVRDRFRAIFGAKLFDLDIVGLDPVHAIVLGLGRHQPLDRIELRYPNWAVTAVLEGQAGATHRLLLYEPYSPLFRIARGQRSASYEMIADIPSEFRTRSLFLRFDPVVNAPGAQWPPVQLPAGSSTLKLTIDLFGDIRLFADTTRLYTGKTSPFRMRDDGRLRPTWLPDSWTRPTIPGPASDEWRHNK